MIFCGGEEKVHPSVLGQPESHYGRPVLTGLDPVTALDEAAAGAAPVAVVDLADEPVLGPRARLRLAARALHLGMDYEAPGLHVRAPRYEPLDFPGPTAAVIGTGKRVGKTAVAAHWAGLLAGAGLSPAVVSMGRGGPSPPRLAAADTTLADLLEEARAGRHAASDYLEDALISRVPAVGCRRVGGGPAGQPHASNVREGAELAASLEPGMLLFEGSGACIPPVEVDVTVCVVGDAHAALEGLGPYRLMRAELVLHMREGAEEQIARLTAGRVVAAKLRPEPSEPVPPGARVAFFSTGRASCAGVHPVVSSSNLARRRELEADLARAAAERCDVYLTELKAAAVDTVIERAVAREARVIFVRNRPVGREVDLDAELMGLLARGS